MPSGTTLQWFWSSSGCSITTQDLRQSYDVVLTKFVSMIVQTLRDDKDMEAEAIRYEADDQKAYEDFVKKIHDSMDAKRKDIVNKSEAKSKREVRVSFV